MDFEAEADKLTNKLSLRFEDAWGPFIIDALRRAYEAGEKRSEAVAKLVAKVGEWNNGKPVNVQQVHELLELYRAITVSKEGR